MSAPPAEAATASVYTWHSILHAYRRTGTERQRVVVSSAPLTWTNNENSSYHVQTDHPPPEFASEHMCSISRHRCNACKTVWWEDSVHLPWEHPDYYKHCPTCPGATSCTYETGFIHVPLAMWQCWLASSTLATSMQSLAIA